ncbi:MAG: RNA polymerase sigma factor [Proteobacteria bacterium]|nr:RNA polymerase sigma factor [Pseudomonadota bacterium]
MLNRSQLDTFLSGVERAAFRMADIATRNPDDALDIVQDAMMKLVEKYADKPAEEWRPLFFSILQSRITDYHRRHSRTRRIFSWFGKEEEDEPMPEVVEPVGPAELLAQRLTLESLIEGLDALPPRQQQVFLLRTWEGFSVAETAKIMKCGEGSVKTHLSRATAALKRAVLEQGEEDSNDAH